VAKKTAPDIKLEDSEEERRAFMKPKIDFNDIDKLTESVIQRLPTDSKHKDTLKEKKHKQPAVLTANSDEEQP